MKQCPQCNRTYYDETFSFCLEDGAVLSPPFDPDATLSFNSVLPELDDDLKINEAVIAITINQQFPVIANAEELYNCTRGLWRVNKYHAERARYAFAVYQGVIKEVYAIDRWLPATPESKEFWRTRLTAQGKDPNPVVNEGRYEFVGRVAASVVRDKYLGRRLPGRRAQNPIRYFNC